MKPYPIQLEIFGPTALWTRPNTGSSPVSYVAPTFRAAKGIFEAILRWKSVDLCPVRDGNAPWGSEDGHIPACWETVSEEAANVSDN
jgi:CRISPR-associated Cas5-like protein